MKNCSFCGVSSNDSNALIVANDSCICESCSKSCLDSFSSNSKSVNKKLNLDLLLTPKIIYNEISKSVIGQEDAKRIISTAAYNHIKKINNPSLQISKSNVLLIGPSGSGKTLILNKLSKILDVPYFMADATTFTEAGYYGDDVDSILTNLYLKSGKDLSVAEKGVVFIDEIDKISSSNGSKNAGNLGVQQGLLKIIEGSEIMISSSLSQDKKNKNISFDTSNILFIFGGSFPGLETVISKRVSNNSIGITANIEKNTNYKSLMGQLKTIDLERYGVIKEFLGRIPVRASLDPVGFETMKRILTDQENSLLSQYKNIFKLDNIELIFEEEAIDAIAKLAIANKTGARGLKGIIEKLLSDLMFDAPSIECDSIIINKQFVTGKGKYLELFSKRSVA
jgi:ATP-dependent Clp protease ATP-binding subunit ClpX